jgi:starvation-inducible DNA-binding protein
MTTAERLIPLFVQTRALFKLYKQVRWQTSDATPYETHSIFDKHYREQLDLMDALVERVEALGEPEATLPCEVVEHLRSGSTRRLRPAADQLRTLLAAHKGVLEATRALEHAATEWSDAETYALVRQIVQTNELQRWLVAEDLTARTSAR